MIYQIFHDKVERFPNQVGFVVNGKEFTYAQADEIVNRVAHYLNDNGVRQGQRVGVMTKDESLHPFIFYALDKLNATYIPFESGPATPELQFKADRKKLDLAHIFIDAEFSQQYQTES